jgi:formylglycine-generating enzyme required for sulfatase activity
MTRLLALIGVAISCVPAVALATCEELKQRIADGMSGGGVTGFHLDIVPVDQVDERKVVGTCEARSKKILYSRTFTTGTSPASSTLQSSPRMAAAQGNTAVAASPASKPTSNSSSVTPAAPRVAAAQTSTVAAVLPAVQPAMSSSSTTPAAARAMSKPTRRGATFRDPLSEGGEGPVMVVIPAGEFSMGSAQTGIDRRYGEGPVHRVKLPAFALARTETTFDDYDRFTKATGRRLADDEGLGRGTRPVVDVSWLDALAYTQWLTAQTGFTYHLPSEAQWEYAARAGGKPGAAYGTGDCISAKQANFNDAATPFNNCPVSSINLGRAQAVASYAPSAFGLYDMHGNVFEWTADCVHLNYEQAPSDGSAWLQEAGGKCSERIVRGGSWQSGQVSVRASLRAGIGYSDPSALIGFRVARVLQPQSR